MMPSYRLPIVIFVLLTMLLFHLGLKSGAKPERGEKIKPTDNSFKPTEWAKPPYSRSRFPPLTASQSDRANTDANTDRLTLKTEGIFVLRRTAKSTTPVDTPFDELLLFDLQGDGVSYPATSVGVPPAPAQSIRF